MTGAWLGIDPGAKGAVALVTDSLARVWDLHPAGLNEARDLVAILPGLVIVVEEQQAFRSADGRVQGVASTFRLGVEYGRILGFFRALDVPVRPVRPAAWKARMGLIGQGKAGSRAMAESLFPGVRIRRHDHAEALLLAEYGRRHL